MKFLTAALLLVTFSAQAEVIIKSVNIDECYDDLAELRDINITSGENSIKQRKFLETFHIKNYEILKAANEVIFHRNLVLIPKLATCMVVLADSKEEVPRCIGALGELALRGRLSGETGENQFTPSYDKAFNCLTK